MKTVVVAFITFAAVCTMMFQSSCKKEVEKDLILNGLLCNSDTISFSKHVHPFINATCMPCHSAAEKRGDIVMETYYDIWLVAMGGYLIPVLKHEPGYAAMPYQQPKISECAIAGLEKWVNAGAPNN